MNKKKERKKTKKKVHIKLGNVCFCSIIKYVQLSSARPGKKDNKVVVCRVVCGAALVYGNVVMDGRQG